MVKVVVSSDAVQSKFKVRDLLALQSPQRSYLSPLSVIAHIDINAFFAQAEQIRLGLSRQDAVVCVQWSSIIAVSYAAREYGISRMDSIESAKLKCDKLVPVHTAVFKKGENFWRYHDEDKDPPSPINHKVSLDPYRRESRKIMKIFKKNCDLVEKASVDESFMDLGRLVIDRILQLIPSLRQQLDKMDKQDLLPSLPSDLNFEAHGFIVGYDDQSEIQISDWDDFVVLLGSSITSEIRAEIESELGYTTSCGVAKVKTVSKLASGFKKPDNQTIVLNSQIPNFVSNFDFTDFWSMGGKTGEYIKTKLSPPDSENIGYIRDNYDMGELEEYLEDKQLAEKLYLMVRGEYAAPLSERILVKSMNSNKNIRGNSGSSLQDASEWIKVFAADLFQRLVESEDENGYRTRAKTISLKFVSKKSGQTHSKQSSLPLVPREEMEETLYKYGVNLLKILGSQFGDIYPLINLNMTISNFEVVDNNSTSIMGFVKKTDVFPTGFASQLTKSNVQPKPSVVAPVPDKERAYEELGDGKFKCTKCGNEVEDTVEHTDFHYAIEISQKLNGSESLSSDLQKFTSSKVSYGELLLKSRSPPTSVGSSSKRTRKSTTTIKNTDKRNKLDKRQTKLPF
ncbi:unnamed protein product [Cyberlindnera jadinii]|uniref:DNA polymerase eta n=1 Tax=Cyberlindnera jadinii (strain ATCC 18201 / CBS 1600 / BCRC 20928 / JCM 3617 / NBRC 0987 / NRRL Y-1542) TaxID=983966 RepID=A0A0H5C6U5_CYBJN|nr:unnamed protein product [Cyberlindnera jadinii]